jgi:ABC-type Mn2+/Zn2+ transport system ATPase subunit
VNAVLEGLRDEAGTPPPAISARGLEARAGDRVLFRALDLDVRAGELVALTGPNGAGKSTLLRILVGLARPAAGSVVRGEGLRIGYVPQLDPGDEGLPFPAATVVRQGLVGRPWRGRAAAVAEALEAVRFRPPRSRRYTVLSGGERRRVLLGRALVARPDLLALDEPTEGVDAAGERDVADLVLRLVATGVAVLWVCHAIPAVERAAHRVVHVEATA